MPLFLWLESTRCTLTSFWLLFLFSLASHPLYLVVKEYDLKMIDFTRGILVEENSGLDEASEERRGRACVVLSPIVLFCKNALKRFFEVTL